MPLESQLLTLVIPAYNEAASLPLLMEELIPFCKSRNWRVIVVNDGSKDASKEVLAGFEENHFLRVLHHKVNRGYGGAIKTGIKHVRTQFCVTIDADGQHDLNDVETMLSTMIEKNTDLIVGNRRGNKASGRYREFGKSIIRRVAKIMMPLKIYDINSGMKMYDTKLAQQYIKLCPDTMAFSDIITLIFIYKRNLVMECPIKIKKRMAGKSTIGLRTAMDTIIEIVNIVILFNPMRVFLPLSITFLLLSFGWELHIFLSGNGVSIGALLGFTTAMIFFLLGLIAEQLGNMRQLSIEDQKVQDDDLDKA